MSKAASVPRDRPLQGRGSIHGLDLLVGALSFPVPSMSWLGYSPVECAQSLVPFPAL